MRIREEVLAKKVEDIVSFVKNNGLLASGEKVDVVITISHGTKIRALIGTEQVSRKRATATDLPVTEQDWTAILSLPLRPDGRSTLEQLRTFGNKPQLPQDIRLKSYGKLVALNQFLSAAQFRIVRVGRETVWGEARYQLVHIARPRSV